MKTRTKSVKKKQTKQVKAAKVSKKTKRSLPKVLKTETPAPKFRFWRWWLGCFFAAFLVAACIRLPHFSQVPRGLNRDEAALGYNAFSILKTGRDEYGTLLPISITSFGDQKLPGYVYTLVPFVATFGLTPFAVRLPSLLSGFIIIGELGLIAVLLAEALQFNKRHQIALSAIAMIFLAITPWANHFSRSGYEAHLALALFMGGFLAYHIAVVANQAKRQQIFLILAALAWSGSFLTYHSYQIFTPLFILALFILDFRRIKQLDRTGLIGAWVIGLGAIGLLVKGGVIQADFIKNRGISPFGLDTLFRMATLYRQYMPGDGSIVSRILFNPFTEALTVFGQNVLSIFSGNFFFIHGSDHGDNNPGGFNNFHPFVAPLLFLGIIQLWEHRHNKYLQRISAWMCLALIPAALTIQPQHEVRLSPLFPLVSLLAGWGTLTVWQHLRKQWQRYAGVGLLVILMFMATIRMYIQYMYIIPATIEGHDKYHVLAETLIRYEDKGFPVITQDPNTSPYIWYLFEHKFDPAKYWNAVERYPADKEGFIHVKRINNIYFENINWDDLYAWAKQTPLILIFKPDQLPIENRKDSRMQFLDSVQDWKGQTVYEIWELNNVTPASSSAQTH